KQRTEIRTANTWRTRNPERRKHGRKEIDRLNRCVHLARCHASRDEDERHVHLLFVDGRAVIAATVLAELLAVIGRHDEDRVPAPWGREPYDRADAFVGRGDLAVVRVDVVRISGIAETMRVVHDIRLVRLEEMHPKKERPIPGRAREIPLDLTGADERVGE